MSVILAVVLTFHPNLDHFRRVLALQVVCRAGVVAAAFPVNPLDHQVLSTGHDPSASFRILFDSETLDRI